MKGIVKCTAWFCVFTTGLLGCTSSTIIEPESETWGKSETSEIESVVLKDGTNYEFEGNQKGTIVAGFVRGISAGQAIAVPLGQISHMTVREGDTVRTVLLVAGVTVGVVVLIGMLATRSGSKSSGSFSGLGFGK